MIFGRAGEEIDACRAANIPVEVVPGISAAQGAAARLLVSLTHRAQSRRLQYVTGHDRDGRLPADIDFASIADPAATTVVYMPKKTLRALAAAAMSHGLDPATPAIAVANATRPDEVVVSGTIADIADRIDAAALTGPALVMIGKVFADVAPVARMSEAICGQVPPHRPIPHVASLSSGAPSARPDGACGRRSNRDALNPSCSSPETPSTAPTRSWRSRRDSCRARRNGSRGRPRHRRRPRSPAASS